MTKHNTDGYVLAYVLVVITVMGLIATTLMTSTLQVIQAQEQSVTYMKDKYEAQGEVERLMANLCAIEKEYIGEYSDTTSKTDVKDTATQKATSEFFTNVMIALGTHDDPVEVDAESDTVVYEVQLQSSNDSVLVNSTIRINTTVSCDEREDAPVDNLETDEDESAITTYTCTYTYNITDIYFTEYTISSVDEDPEGGGI